MAAPRKTAASRHGTFHRGPNGEMISGGAPRKAAKATKATKAAKAAAKSVAPAKKAPGRTAASVHGTFHRGPNGEMISGGTPRKAAKAAQPRKAATKAVKAVPRKAPGRTAASTHGTFHRGPHGEMVHGGAPRKSTRARRAPAKHQSGGIRKIVRDLLGRFA